MRQKPTAPNLIVWIAPVLIVLAFVFLPWYAGQNESLTGFDLLSGGPRSAPFYVGGTWLIALSAILAIVTAVWLALSWDATMPRAVSFNAGAIGLFVFLLFALQLLSNAVPDGELSRVGIGGIVVFVALCGLLVQAFLPDVSFAELPATIAEGRRAARAAAEADRVRFNPRSGEVAVAPARDRRYPGIVLFVAGALALISYFVLPWIGVQGLTITASDLRSGFSLITIAAIFNPQAMPGELGMQVNLVMIGGLIALAAGIAGMISTNMISRVVGAFAGALCLAHFADFIGRLGLDIVGQLAQLGFWLALVAAIAMIVQAFLPGRRE